MAGSLDDAEFWLPPQFLTDDDLLMDVNNTKTKTKTKNDKDGFAFGSENDAFSRSLFPYELPYGFGPLGVPSDLSSPVESVVGSSETESDEEDYLAGLTLQMARSTLEDSFKNSRPESGKPWTLSGSPQSTLCAVGSGCGCGQGSSRESPKAHSRVSSPPETWDLLNEAAGEVAKMRMNEEEYKFYRGLLGPLRKPSPVVNTANHPDIGFHLNQSISQKQLQASQFQQLRQQQMMRQQQSSSMWGVNTTTTSQAKLPGQYETQAQPVVQNRGGRNSEFFGSKNSSRPLGLSPSAWPPLQQAQAQAQVQAQNHHHNNGSGMRAVFLGNPAAKRECAGTGVFLPRQAGTQPETRRKPACSTVLVPARVVQALNLNVDDMSAQPQFQPRFNGRFAPDNDVTLRLRSNNVVSHQKRNMRPQPSVNHEIRLPQDWTY